MTIVHAKKIATKPSLQVAEPDAGTNVLFVGSVVPAVAAPPLVHAQVLSPDSWKTAVSGAWSTAADWSAGVPTSSNDVTVSVAGTYTVTIGAAAISNSVTLNNATAKINDTSTLTVATNLAVTAGQFIVNGTGTLVGGTISVGASGKFLAYSGATLSGITYQGTLTPSVNGTIYVENGITLTGAGGTGNGVISMASGSALDILDSETLNNATLTFGAGAAEYLYLNEASSTSTQSLTLGSGFTISQTAGTNIIGPYEQDGGSITDAGLISVSGGTLTMGNGLGIFSDSGSIAVSGGVFDLTTEMAASGTITASGTGAFLLDSTGVLTGTATMTGALHASYGLLYALTLHGPLSFAAGQVAYIQGGLLVTGTGGTGAGTISLSAGAETIYVLDNETLNNETLSFGSSNGSTFGLYEASNVSTQTLTLGSGFVVTQSGGTNYLDGYEYDNGLLVNAGTIAVTGGDLVDNLGVNVLDNTGKILVSAGTFTASNSTSLVNAGSIVVSGGVFDLETAMTSTGSLATSGGGVFEIGSAAVLSGTVTAAGTNFSFEGGTLSAASWQGPLTFVGTGQIAYIAGGLSVTGTGGTGSGTINLAAGTDSLYVLDSETLNNETLNFGSSTGNAFGLYEPYNTTTQTLTLGSGFIITQSGGTNDLDGYYSGTDGLLIDQGTISISGGDLVDDQNLSGFTNSGKIAVSGGTFTAENAGIFTNTGSVVISGGVFDLETTMASTGSVATSGSGVFEIGSAALLSGTIAASGTNFSFEGGTLSAVNWQGPLTLGAGQTAYIEGGLSVTGTGGTGHGTISLSAGTDSLYVLDNEMLNNETLNFGTGTGSRFGLYEASNTTTQTLTLGSGFILTQTGGTNYLDGYYYGTNGLLINQGTIAVSGGDLVDDADISGFTSSGTIAVLGGTFTAENAGIFTNTGNLVISGGVFDLETTMTSTGNVAVSGGGIFKIGSSAVLSGAIISAGSNFSFQGGTLSATTWQGPLIPGANQTLFVENGLTVTGASGTGNGTISLAAGGDTLIVLDTETLNNATLTFGGGSGSIFYVDGSSATQNVTLGSGFSLVQTGGSNSIQGYYGNYLGNLANAGLINVSGGTLSVVDLTTFANSGSIDVTAGTMTTSDITTFTNTGTVALSNTGSLDLSGDTKFGSLVSGTLSGTYLIGAGSVLELVNNVAVTTLAGSVSLTGAGSLIQSTNTTSGNQAGFDASLTTVAATGALTLGAGRNFTGARAFVDNGSVSLGGGTLTETSITLGNTGTLSGSGKITPAITNGGLIIASGGLLTAAGALSGTGSVTIKAGATFEAGAATSATQTLSFAALGAKLLIDAPASFAGVLAGFAAGDVIDVAKTTLTSASASGTSLLAVSAAGTTTLTLAAPLTGEHLSLGADGASGTDITAYALAQSSLHSPEPVAFANHHVGDSVSTALTLANITAANGYAEALDASFGTLTGSATASGSFSGLAAGSTNSTSLLVGLNTATAGTLAGTAVITLASDGTGIDGFGATSLGTQLVNVSGAVYAFAQASVANSGTVTLANTHVGQTASATLAVGNAAAANGYSEALDAALGGASSGFSASGSFAGLAAGSQSSALTLGYAGGADGAYAGTATLSLLSDGTGIDGLGTTALAPQTITIAGNAYAYAASKLSSSAITLGIVHVGQADSAALTLTNTAAANGFSEALDAAWGTATGLTTSGSLTRLSAGQTDMSSLAVGLATSTSGSFAGSAVLGLVSDGTGIDGLGTTTLTGQTITVAGIVDAYALAAFEDPGGPAIAGSGTSYAITLASVAQGSAADILSLGALNAATGLSDLLQGTISTAGGAGFTNSGFGSFSGLGAGQGEHSQSATLSTSTAGTFTETILLSSAGTNASGYSGALATDTLTVTGVVTPVGSNTYTLAAGPNSIVGAAGGDVFIAPATSLNSRDSLTGGAGANVIQFTGGGQFDLGAPRVFSNIPTVTAYEGQTAAGTVASTQQVVFLRDGANETLSVVAGVAAKGDTNPESIVIYSSNATNTITLASGSDQVILSAGTDTVVLGGSKNSVAAGGGTALVQGSAATANASVVGTSTGSTTLEITTGGTVTLNAADTYLTVKLDAATVLTTGKLGFITVNGGNGGDTIRAGGTGQTLIGGAGDHLFGAVSGSTVFEGASTALTGNTLYDWAAGDVIDLTNVNSATLSPLTFANGKLTVSDGTHTAGIYVSGTGLALHNFVVAGSDGNGGTLIDYHS